MKLDQHTVTIPISDYQELMDAKANADKRFTELRDWLVKRLGEFRFTSHFQPHEIVADIIKTLNHPL